MTKAQERSIQRIKDNVVEWDNYMHCKPRDGIKYELFTFKTKDYEHFISVCTRTGWINQHGVAILVSRHMLVYKGGAIHAFGRRPRGHKQVKFTKWIEALCFGKEYCTCYSEEMIREMQQDPEENDI